MRSESGIAKQGAFHSVSGLIGSILAEWNIIVPCVLLAVFLSLLSWGFLLGHAAAEQEEGRHASFSQVQTMAQAYSERLARVINWRDLMLRQMRYSWQLSRESLAFDTPWAARMFRGAPFSNLAILDRNGVLVTAIKPQRIPANAAQAPYFRIHAGSEHDPLVISLVEDVAGKVRGLRFSRSIRAADLGFDGVILIQDGANELTTNFFTQVLPPLSLVGMARKDGRALLAVSDPRGPLTFGLPELAGPQGVATLGGSAFDDGRRRYLGWHQVGGYPIVAFIALDEATAMAPFAAERGAAITKAKIMTAAIFGMCALVMGFLLRLTWRKREIARTTETYRMATEGSSDGFFIVGILQNSSGAVDDFEIIDCNEHGAALWDQRRDILIGLRFSGMYRDDTFSHVMEVLRKTVDVGAYEDELEFLPRGSDKVRWMKIKAVRSDTKLAITLRDISESKAHVAALEYRGNHDALTGLPNRHWLQWYLPQAIGRARDNRQTLALLFIDLDGFKAANDTMGHAAGDELLRHAAHRLKEAVRPHDNVVRLGGDEFVVILENNLRVEDAAIIAKRVIFAFKPKFKLMGGTAVLGTSIGISSFPSDGEDAATLLQNADVAMYSVKTSGKGSFRFFDPEFYEALRKELEFEQELRRAIEVDEFVIHYQPRMDLASNRSTSMEALVRWMHPMRGLLEPKDFIPLAEKSGMIVRLGELVLLKVCEQLAQWVAREETVVPVSVNISSRQFNETNVARIFSNAIAQHGLPSNLLEIELTESSMMGGGSDALESLARLRELGVKLLVDDFGTGYSSLAQLQLLHFDILKVDKAFTSRIEQTEQGKILFTAIITMAHALGMRVVAEGVETQSQLHILRALACDEVQGYFISYPQAAAEVQSVLLAPG